MEESEGEGEGKGVMMPIAISNVRLGLATNSSSTHSLLLLEPERPLPSDALADGYWFGWDHFTLAGGDAKMRYLAAQVYGNLAHALSPFTARAVVLDLFGVRLPGDAPDEDEPYVDHQSLWLLPTEWDGHGIDRAFLNDLRCYLLQERLIILGGNDDEGGWHPLRYLGEAADLPLPSDVLGSLVARKDGDWWVLFNRQTGAKIRLSFQRSPTPYTKATWPELVDLKITQRCTRNCGLCYQDSGPQGEHADERKLYSIIHMLGSLRVFEVAIGGGEPTEHPTFCKLLSDCRYYGIVPNFSTGSYRWLDDEGIRDAVLRYAGRFAFSPIRLSDEEKWFRKAWGKYGIDRERFAFHYVLGAQSAQQLGCHLRQAKGFGVDVVLLGYKQQGRAKDTTPQDNSNWLDIVHTAGLRQVSIDTAVVQQYPAQVAATDRSGLCVTRLEGSYSCYIDAVTQRVGPSSYCAPEALRPLPDTPKELVTTFKDFGHESRFPRDG